MVLMLLLVVVGCDSSCSGHRNFTCRRCRRRGRLLGIDGIPFSLRDGHWLRDEGLGDILLKLGCFRHLHLLAGFHGNGIEIAGGCNSCGGGGNGGCARMETVHFADKFEGDLELLSLLSLALECGIQVGLGEVKVVHRERGCQLGTEGRRDEDI